MYILQDLYGYRMTLVILHVTQDVDRLLRWSPLFSSSVSEKEINIHEPLSSLEFDKYERKFSFKKLLYSTITSKLHAMLRGRIYIELHVHGGIEESWRKKRIRRPHTHQFFSKNIYWIARKFAHVHRNIQMNSAFKVTENNQDICAKIFEKKPPLTS